jgi:hypothetical protein
LPNHSRHPGLDPGSIHPALREWIPDQVPDDDEEWVAFRSKPAGRYRENSLSALLA